eukprot:SM000011S18952  [mRNA]  locus=s11:28162:30705:- [translate_table: standard]
MLQAGPVYRLAAGPRNFVIIGEPQAAKHVLRGTGTTYAKGLVAEVAQFLFGSGFAIAEGPTWTARRRAVVPSLHRKYLATMVDEVFAESAERLSLQLEAAARDGAAVNMEEKFSQLTLDVIGKAVFNYSFDSLNRDSPVIQAVYTALKETESRATDILPYWQVPLLCKLVPRQRRAAEAVRVIRTVVEDLVAQCKAIVEREGETLGEDGEEYLNESDPSVLRFLLASREEVLRALHPHPLAWTADDLPSQAEYEVSSEQLRDDLLSMLVAGHETTGSVLTWTVFLLAQARLLAPPANPEAREKVANEVDKVLGGRRPTFADTRELKYTMRCINESMRLYPHPPVLIRRATKADVLPGGYRLDAGQDVMISVYNVHHSPQASSHSSSADAEAFAQTWFLQQTSQTTAVWDRAEEFLPERFSIDEPIPSEVTTDYRYIPFSGGPRKCVGDQFALLEALVALAVLLQRFHFELVPNQDIGMTTGATIHTKNGLYMTVKERALPRVPALA